MAQEWTDIDNDGEMDDSEMVTYLAGPCGVEYRENSSGVKWYVYDGLGSIVAQVGEDGTVTRTPKLDVYGSFRETDNGVGKQRFCGSLGHTSEPDTGLIYMRAQWMDPATGRFVSEDPARDGANWYGYCANNPVNQVDPDGRQSLGETTGLLL